MAVKNGKHIAEYRAVIRNVTPLNISDNDGKPIIDEENNEAIIPGTSTTGAFRAYLSKRLNPCKIDELFGENALSKIFIYDSYANINGYEMRPAIRMDGVTGTAAEGGKFDRYLLSVGHEFVLKAEVYADEDKDFQEYKNYFEDCIEALDDGTIQLGSFKSIGTGIFNVISIKKREYNLSNKSGMFKYLKRNESEGFRDVKLNKNESQSGIVTFELSGSLKTPLLITGYSSLDHTRPDNEQMIDSKGNFIVPGSSLKGLIRAEVEKIFRIFNREEETECIFGTSADKENKKSSKIIVMDSIIENYEVQTYNRIRVDKFNGGVMKSALAQDAPVLGDINICVKYKLQENEDLDGSIIAALTCVFRDIAIGNIPIGGGSNIGRGRVEGNILKVFKGSELIYERNYKKDDDDCNKLDTYYQTLNRKRCV